jgi:hypothetical protein
MSHYSRNLDTLDAKKKRSFFLGRNEAADYDISKYYFLQFSQRKIRHRKNSPESDSLLAAQGIEKVFRIAIFVSYFWFHWCTGKRQCARLLRIFSVFFTSSV